MSKELYDGRNQEPEETGLGSLAVDLLELNELVYQLKVVLFSFFIVMNRKKLKKIERLCTYIP